MAGSRVFALVTAAAALLVGTWAQAQQPQPVTKGIVVESAAGSAPADALRLVPPIGHTGLISEVQVFPDGKRVASAAWDATIGVWDLDSGRQLRAFSGHAAAGANQAYSVAIHPGGRQVASAANDGSVRIWNPDTGQEIHRFRVSQVNRIRYVADGGLLVSAGQSLAVYDPLTGAKRRDFENIRFGHHFDVAPDGRTLVAGYGTFEDKDKGVQVSGTAYIADAVTGEVRHTLQHAKVVYAVGISRDGSVAATADQDNVIRLWNTATGQMLRELTGYDGLIYGSVAALEFSADGAQLISGGAGGQHGQAWIWDVAAGKKLRQVQLHPQHIKSLDLSPDGTRVVSASKDETLAVWTLADGKVQQRLAGTMEHAAGIAFSPDGSRVLTALSSSRQTGWTGGGLRLWDRRTGRPLRRFQAQMQVRSCAYSPDGKLVAAAGQNEVNVWEVDTGKRVLHSQPGGYAFFECLQFSPDSKHVLTVAGNVYQIEVATGAVRKTQGSWVAGAYSPDGTLVAASGGKECVVLKADTGEVVRRLPVQGTHPSSHASGVAFSRDGKTLALAGYAVALHRWDVATGQLLGATPTTGLPDFRVEDALVAGPDGTWAFNVEGSVGIYDAQGRLLRSLPHRKQVQGSAFLPDGRLMTCGDDGVLRLWEPKAGTQELSYLPLLNDDWLAIAADGRFDGSEGGIAQVYFVRGTQTYDLEQFAEQFRAPGLVGSVLADGGGQPAVAQAAPAPNATAAVASGAPPRVVIASPTPGAASAQTVDVVVEATEQGGGGFGGIRLYHNGRLVGGPPGIRGIEVLAAAPAAPAEALKKSFSVRLVSGENVLRATALSRTGLESAPAEVKVTFAAAPVGKPTLHVLVVGINQYRDGTLNLSYARPDAEAIGGFFETSPAAKSLFSEVKIHRLLDNAATGEAIRQSLATIATSSQPDDVVFLYFAGHGEMAPAKDTPGAAETFFFLPAEMRQIALKERVRELGISGAEIEGTIAKMAARKIVLVYDACKSGGAVAGGVRGAADEQQALGALARAQGIHILTASTSQQYAGEVKALGHGILTYALLEGLQGKAARTGNPAVYVRELMSYVEDRVPQLAREHRGQEQWPVPFGRGQNFPVALGGTTP